MIIICHTLLFVMYVTIGPVAKFKDTTYSVVEGNEVFSVVIEKVGTTAETNTLLVLFIAGSATSKRLL